VLNKKDDHYQEVPAMPIYEYTCLKCNEAFTILKLSIADEETVCPSCGSKDVEKKMSLFGCSMPSSSPSGGFSAGG
jgi:putative FmdB family regulatory protein